MLQVDVLFSEWFVKFRNWRFIVKFFSNLSLTQKIFIKLFFTLQCFSFKLNFCDENSSFKTRVTLSQRIYHVGCTSSHLNTEVKQHWAWILLGWETLQGIPGSAGAYPPPLPLQTEYSLFRLSLSQSSDWDPLKPKKNSAILKMSKVHLHASPISH